MTPTTLALQRREREPSAPSAYDPHRVDLHIKWSIQRVAPDVLHVHSTLFDDEAFTRPVTMTNVWPLKMTRKREVLDDASCFENASSVTDTKPPAPGFLKF